MDYATAAALLLKYGPEFVNWIIGMIQKKGIVTADEWAAGMKLAGNTPRTKIIEAAAALGIPETDPRVIAALAMVP